MKDIICPHCKHKVLKIIGIRWINLGFYYIDRKSGSTRAWLWDIVKHKNRKDNKDSFVCFTCRFCYHDFPKEMEKDIWKKLRLREILYNLTP